MIRWLTCSVDECPVEVMECLLSPERTSPPEFLSKSERETFSCLNFFKRRREWLLGRWTAKRLLRLSRAAYHSLPLSAITVGSDRDGAPYLHVDGAGRLPASLSISHRGRRAFCALSFSPSLSIGADIEHVEPRIPAFVNDFFTAQESERVWACPEPVRDTLIALLWSAKEAVLKALRQGLRVDTRRVEIHHLAGIASQDIASSSWYQVRVSSELPGAAHIASWWRPDGDDVLTLAAASTTPIDPAELVPRH